MSVTKNIEIDKGDRETFTGTVTDATGAAVDIQGSDIFFVIKKTEDDTTAVLSLQGGLHQPSAQVEILDDGSTPNRGKYRIRIYPGDLDNVEPGFYVYSIRVTYGVDDSHTIVRGTALVIEDVADG